MGLSADFDRVIHLWRPEWNILMLFHWRLWYWCSFVCLSCWFCPPVDFCNLLCKGQWLKIYINASPFGSGRVLNLQIHCLLFWGFSSPVRTTLKWANVKSCSIVLFCSPLPDLEFPLNDNLPLVFIVFISGWVFSRRFSSSVYELSCTMHSHSTNSMADSSEHWAPSGSCKEGHCHHSPLDNALVLPYCLTLGRSRGAVGSRVHGSLLLH